MDTDAMQETEQLLQDMTDERPAFVEPLEERIGIAMASRSSIPSSRQATGVLPRRIARSIGLVCE